METGLGKRTSFFAPIGDLFNREAGDGAAGGYCWSSILWRACMTSCWRSSHKFLQRLWPVHPERTDGSLSEGQTSTISGKRDTFSKGPVFRKFHDPQPASYYGSCLRRASRWKRHSSAGYTDNAESISVLRNAEHYSGFSPHTITAGTGSSAFPATDGAVKGYRRFYPQLGLSPCKLISRPTEHCGG